MSGVEVEGLVVHAGKELRQWRRAAQSGGLPRGPDANMSRGAAMFLLLLPQGNKMVAESMDGVVLWVPSCFVFFSQREVVGKRVPCCCSCWCWFEDVLWLSVKLYSVLIRVEAPHSKWKITNPVRRVYEIFIILKDEIEVIHNKDFEIPLNMLLPFESYNNIIEKKLYKHDLLKAKDVVDNGWKCIFDLMKVSS